MKTQKKMWMKIWTQTIFLKVKQNIKNISKTLFSMNI